MASEQNYFIPYLDGDWHGYGPLDPQTNFGLLPPNKNEIQANFIDAIGLWKEQTDGKVLFGAHTGTYCRELFYEAPMLELYRELISNGGEIAVHPHEERVNAGHIIEHLDHMAYIISWKRQQLLDAGIVPTALRLPYNAWVPGMTKIAEDNELFVDLSSAPDYHNEYWRSDWRGAPASAFFLDYDNPATPHSAAPSRVLEVPQGWDGVTAEPGHYLFNEQTELDVLKSVWDAICARSKTDGPQTVYYLCHLHAMAIPDLRARICDFIDYAKANSGVAITPSEAYAMHREALAA